MTILRVCLHCCAQQQKRRGSKVQEDEDDEVSKYFKVKPENQVVKLGQYSSLRTMCIKFNFSPMQSVSIGLFWFCIANLPLSLQSLYTRIYINVYTLKSVLETDISQKIYLRTENKPAMLRHSKLRA